MLTSDRTTIILASGSPRRRELIERFWGPDRVQVLVPDYDETAQMSLLYRKSAGIHALADSRTLASQLAAGKLNALHSQFSLPETYIALAADTLVVLDDKIMGKPADDNEADSMLRLLSGRTHQVISGLSVDIARGGQVLSLQATEVTHVRFARLEDTQIAWYVKTGEPLDKAGAYGIQGYGAAFVKQIDGCYYNVMGLPVNRLMVLLQQASDHFSSGSSFISFLPWA